MLTSNWLTGEANYFEEKTNKERIIDIVKASSSLPFICPVAYADGIPILDGGITDSIPVERSLSQGFEKNVIVLTRNKGYRKKDKNNMIPSFIYRKYPKMRKTLKKRNCIYNKQLELVDRMEEKGNAIVIRSRNPIVVDRMEKDADKLLALYKEGYELAKAILKI